MCMYFPDTLADTSTVGGSTDSDITMCNYVLVVLQEIPAHTYIRCVTVHTYFMKIPAHTYKYRRYVQVFDSMFQWFLQVSARLHRLRGCITVASPLQVDIASSSQFVAALTELCMLHMALEVDSLLLLHSLSSRSSS